VLYDIHEASPKDTDDERYWICFVDIYADIALITSVSISIRNMGYRFKRRATFCHLLLNNIIQEILRNIRVPRAAYSMCPECTYGSLNNELKPGLADFFFLNKTLFFLKYVFNVSNIL